MRKGFLTSFCTLPCLWQCNYLQPFLLFSSTWGKWFFVSYLKSIALITVVIGVRKICWYASSIIESVRTVLFSQCSNELNRAGLDREFINFLTTGQVVHNLFLRLHSIKILPVLKDSPLSQLWPLMKSKKRHFYLGFGFALSCLFFSPSVPGPSTFTARHYEKIRQQQQNRNRRQRRPQGPQNMTVRNYVPKRSFFRIVGAIAEGIATGQFLLIYFFIAAVDIIACWNSDQICATMCMCKDAGVCVCLLYFIPPYLVLFIHLRLFLSVFAFLSEIRSRQIYRYF